MGKRPLGQSADTNKQPKIEPSSSSGGFSSDVLCEIAQFSPVNEILQLSLVNKHYHSIFNSDIVWKTIFERKYKDRVINEKDPLFGGEILSKAKSKFSSSSFKAFFALKESFKHLTVVSYANVFKKYAKLFEEDEPYSYVEGDENFKPTIEMQQMLTQYQDNGGEGTYGAFFRDECAENESLLEAIVKNPLTDQGRSIFTFIEIAHILINTKNLNILKCQIVILMEVFIMEMQLLLFYAIVKEVPMSIQIALTMKECMQILTLYLTSIDYSIA